MLMIRDKKLNTIKYTNIQQACILTGVTKHHIEKYIDQNVLLLNRYKVVSISKSNISVKKETIDDWDKTTERFRKHYAKARLRLYKQL